MDLDTLIVTVFCQIDDMLVELFADYPIRQRGASPALSDAEVLTLELIGEYLGLAQDKQIFEYFRRHDCHFFPHLRRLHRTTFTRQAANLWRVKELVWQRTLKNIEYDPAITLIDSFPIPVCRFARANRVRVLRDVAAYGFDEMAKQTFFGGRLHLRVSLPGVITAIEFAPANIHELEVAQDLLDKTRGFGLGDRNYWSPSFFERCRAHDLQMIVPYRSAKRERKRFPPWLTNMRRRIETVIGQLTERFHIKRVWARDAWHLCSRLLRKVLAHTFCVFFCQQYACEPSQMARLLSS